MSDTTADAAPNRSSGPQAGGSASSGRQHEKAPGEHREHDVAQKIGAYSIGLSLAALLTAGSFVLSYTHVVYGPALPIALIVFAVAQIGIHLVFFLHLTTSPDNINNSMALAFGTLIVLLLIGGTLWIMAHMYGNMMPPSMSTGSGM